ncbi:MAG: ATP-binding cassette domain-containing protein [Burkholderiales bacterium]|nr:ATP-binding cassette domain-containing protein [Burkholderiales bacterium]
MIRFDRVGKRYPGGIEVLARVSLEIARGELVVVTGPSGAGKSTLLNLMAGIELPTVGHVAVNGENLSRMRPRALPYLRRQFGLVFQDHKLLYDRSVFDNVALPLRIVGFDAATIPGRVSAALDKVGLLDRSRSPPIALSGGEQQRLCIARAIVHRPAILLADEPTANLDPDYAAAIADLLLSLNRAGVTVVIATHDRAVSDRLPTRRIELRAARLHEAAA